MKHDLLHIQGKPYVLIPLHEYRVMTGGDSAIEDGVLPDDILDTLSAGQEHPIRILRKYRDMTQQELADAAGLSRPYLTEIERGNKDGSVRALRTIADALQIDPRFLMS